MLDLDDDTYILLLLADSNLPTGSFVASSGLESYMKHGFASLAPSVDQAIVTFVRHSLSTYARSVIPFVSDVHRLISSANPSELYQSGGEIMDSLAAIDRLYEASTLNHVTRRASMTQGVALLTLYSKGLSNSPGVNSNADSQRTSALSRLVDKYKLLIRREETPGHLPVCWGILTAALGLSLERAQYLHLFLHARGLLSAAVRLNEIGPYGAQQLLLHVVRPLVAAELQHCSRLRTGVLESEQSEYDVTVDGPANTWPLGEVIATRHDLQHSRIFNS
ncbi:hypothetical protein AMATHDRAFT_142992 [Amanita thiersii Skay4041]|uniref:Urease accessory protein UreF n=1 Tax=Amanita thiersii Skay4041 TaxID=703135 RepID=A0A2A9NPS1_9AGAR|nr:hypothetical protein AMATHDRAFT_142992 [Amanita thiersii Skay4041]